MANRRGNKANPLLATLVTENRAPCAFCNRMVDEEVTYGKLYAIGDIQCHYFCVLLSCCLIQKGKDEEGLFGFLYLDILAEIQRSKKHKCSYCGKGGATLGCAITQCRKQFHLSCGREKNAVSLFYDNYKSYCKEHSPTQKIPDHIMTSARLRKRAAAKGSPGDMVCVICYEAVDGFPAVGTFWPPCCARDAWFHRSCLQRMALSAGMHYLKCPLCNDKETFYDAVVKQGYYVPDRDAAWELEQNAFAEIYERPLVCNMDHCLCPNGRSHDDDHGPWNIILCLLCGTLGAHVACLPANPAITNLTATPIDSTSITTLDDASNSLVAGNNALTSPLGPNGTANEVQTSQNNADSVPVSLNDLNGVPLSQNGSNCTLTSQNDLNGVPISRNGLNGPSTSQNDSNGAPLSQNTAVIRFVCSSCRPAAPKDLESLALKIDTVIQAEQQQSGNNAVLTRPLMPCRMSLRRTKQRIAFEASSTSQRPPKTQCVTVSSRLELNLKTPRKLRNKEDSTQQNYQELGVKNQLLSPIKMLERGLSEKIKCMGANELDIDYYKVIERARDTFKKPRPLSEKQRIIDKLLDSLFDKAKDNPKTKMPVKEWTSPKKIFDVQKDMKESIDTNIPIEDYKTIIKNEVVADKDDSSNSTFQLPPEFVADHRSDDSLPLFETTKKLKTVDIQKDSSLEISLDDVVNIDMVKMEADEEKSFNANISKTCVFKFSPLDKETLEGNANIDLECFKNRYLSEVDKVNIQNTTDKDEGRMKKRKAYKRKVLTQEGEKRKKRRKFGTKRVLEYDQKDGDIKLICKEEETSKNINQTINLSLEANDNEKSEKGCKKFKRNKKSRKNQNIQVKIRWKEEQINLQITKSKSKKQKKNKYKNLKQYILEYPTKASPSKNTVIVKPEYDITPRKRKYGKIEKSPDNLVQTSLKNFFKPMTIVLQ